MGLADNIQLSIVSTIYNDEKIVPILTEEIIKHVAPLNIVFEIIYVNDNSKDNSENVIRSVAAKYPFVKGLSLSRNFGQQIAMSAGMRYATGKYILIMDGDMQNPPSEIPKLYEKIQNGVDIVYCISKTRNSFSDRLTSSIFWFILVKLFKVPIVRDQLMMKIMTRRFLAEYNRYNEVHRTVTGLVKDIGFKHDILEIQNQKRLIGKSNYNVFRRFNLMIDMIINLSNAPLNFMIYFGLILFVLTSVFSLYHIFMYLFYDVSPGFTSIILSIFFFGSVTVLMLGFIGRYMSNIYSEARQRPLYIVREFYNFGENLNEK